MDRALNNVLAGEQRGATHQETALALLGQVGRYIYSLGPHLPWLHVPWFYTSSALLTMASRTLSSGEHFPCTWRGSPWRVEYSALNTTMALLEQVGGVAWLAYFTSTMVQLVTNMNHLEELARAKIGRVATFCRHARIPTELAWRVNAHLEHVLLAKKVDLDTNELLAELSAPLRGEVALHRCHAFLLNPKFMGILGYDSEDENSVEQGMFIKA